MSALTEETLDLDERLEVYVDTETYASTVIEIRTESTCKGRTQPRLHNQGNRR